MTNRRKPTRGLPTLLKAAGIISILAAFSFWILPWSEIRERYELFRAERLIRSAESRARTTYGRLSEASYSANDTRVPIPDEFGNAQLILLPLPDSARARYLKSLIDIGTSHWTRAADTLTQLAGKDPADPRVFNDLGVVLMQLADTDAIDLFKALDQFELAEARQPNAPEAHFNRLLILRKLQLTHRAALEEAEYSKLDRTGGWHDELMPPQAMEEEKTAHELQQALDRHDNAAALTILTQAPAICRKIAMQYALNPNLSENKQLAGFVADELSKNYGDKTVSEMLSALAQENPANLIEARRLVEEGAEFYLKLDQKSSLESYEKATAVLGNSNSVVDRLWIDVNRADTEIRLNKLDEVKSTLDRIVPQARARNLKWILALALTPYGAVRSLNSSWVEMMGRLEEAVRVSGEIGEPRISVRARYYMMGQRFFGGDLDGSLRLAVDCLSFADATDHLRLSSIQSVIGAILYKKGMLNQAATAEDESVYQAAESKNSGIVVFASTSLALIDEFQGHSKEADADLKRADDALSNILQQNEHVRSQVNIDLMKARIYLKRGRTSEADSQLKDAREALDTNSIPGTIFSSQVSMLQGETYARSQQLPEAKAAFREGIDTAEDDSNFIKSASGTPSFDDARRELYDSAISFEYGENDTDAAWTYLQKYQAKLFIESLIQFNPAIEQVHTIALDRGKVQKSIPAGLQVIEYALLPDRLTIWVATGKTFETRSVAISRAVVEGKVQNLLGKLRSGQPLGMESSDLYNVLIGPISGLLKPDMALAIVPDRALHGLPFAALKNPAGIYLIEQYPILVSPTLTHLLAATAVNPKRNVLTMFGSKTNDADEMREIDAIKEVYRQTSAVAGPAVEKEGFLNALQRSAVFHYAGHSAHDAADALRSEILLDGRDGGPNSVTALDIVDRKMPENAVVILSSCDSSVGNSKDGIGLRGLTSAFLISGAGAVVGSLWPVEAGSTSQLMIEFHKNFAKDGMSVAEALRAAQLWFMKTYPRKADPYYWSGFEVTGNASALRKAE